MTRLSIGAKWTLRYTAVMLLAVSLLAAYTYLRIDQRFHQDARFLVDLQLKELVDTLQVVPVGDPALQGILERNRYRLPGEPGNHCRSIEKHQRSEGPSGSRQQ